MVAHPTSNSSSSRLFRLTLPPPQRGADRGTFAERTVTERLPGIARQVLENHPWHEQACRRLSALIAEMPHGRLRPLEDSQAPDLPLWRRWLAPYTGRTWLEAPWFVAEMYFFRRILEACGYFSSGPGEGVDPYREQKRAALEALETPLAAFCDRVGAMKGASWETILATLLPAMVWGNQGDLSLWPLGSRPAYAGQTTHAEGLLVEDTPSLLAFLGHRTLPLARLDLLLDNVGLELGFDLLASAFFLDYPLARQVVLHAKPYPTYVSDATPQDVGQTIAFLKRSRHPCLRALGERLSAHRREGRLNLQADFYWISPLAGWQMPAALRRALAQSDLLLSKGDAHYRRWLGDRRWPFTTPFSKVLAYRPAPLLALRVLKSELMVGLPAGTAEQVAARDAEWLTDGAWGVIQFAP